MRISFPLAPVLLWLNLPDWDREMAAKGSAILLGYVRHWLIFDAFLTYTAAKVLQPTIS
jgi:hypothetical protein